MILTVSVRAQETVIFDKYDFESTEKDGCAGWTCGKFAAIKLEPKVVEFPGLSAEDLYTRAKKWMNETYRRGEDIILGDNINEYIRFEGYSDQIVYQFMLGSVSAIPVYFQVEIRFRDGRYRWEYISWRQSNSDNVLVRPTFFASFKLLNSRGKPVNPQHIFALQKTQAALAIPINSLTSYLLTEDGSAEDW